MFSNDQNTTCEVVITLSDGEDIIGSLNCGLSGKLEFALNNEKPFLEISDEYGEASFISKTQVAKISVAKKNDQKLHPLKFKASSSELWFEVLGVGANAGFEAVKKAYHDLAKAYHPDRFTNDMPIEIRQYASDKFASINIAYDQYQSARKVA